MLRRPPSPQPHLLEICCLLFQRRNRVHRQNAPQCPQTSQQLQPREAHHTVERSRLFCLQQLSSQKEFAIWCHFAANWHIEICAWNGMALSSPMGDTLPLRTQRSTTRPSAGAPPSPAAGKGEQQCRREPPLRAQPNGTPHTPCSPCSAPHRFCKGRWHLQAPFPSVCHPGLLRRLRPPGAEVPLVVLIVLLLLRGISSTGNEADAMTEATNIATHRAEHVKTKTASSCSA